MFYLLPGKALHYRHLVYLAERAKEGKVEDRYKCCRTLRGKAKRIITTFSTQPRQRIARQTF